jgi:hypothetical protein
MRKFFFFVALSSVSCIVHAQGAGTDISIHNLNDEVAKLKEIIRGMQENELQSEKIKYQRNYQMVLYGVEIIKDIHQGTTEIKAARSQNMLYKKIMDINNPTSETLGFQLQDVIEQSVGEIILTIPLADNDRKRLKGQLSGFVDGLKKAFPPLQILTGALSGLSSFTTYSARMEKIGRKADSIIIEATHPITREALAKINDKLTPYIDFYMHLNKINSTYENALYSHLIEYKDFIDEADNLKRLLESYLNFQESIGEQINNLFDLANSSRQDFDFKKITEQEHTRSLAGICMNVYGLVDRYKKFTNDFINIQEDFFTDNIRLLNDKAKKLPLKEDGKIDGLIAELNQIKSGNPAAGIPGFDEVYRSKLKNVASKLYAMNRTRF